MFIYKSIFIFLQSKLLFGTWKLHNLRTGPGMKYEEQLRLLLEQVCYRTARILFPRQTTNQSIPSKVEKFQSNNNMDQKHIHTEMYIYIYTHTVRYKLKVPVYMFHSLYLNFSELQLISFTMVDCNERWSKQTEREDEEIGEWLGT